MLTNFAAAAVAAAAGTIIMSELWTSEVKGLVLLFLSFLYSTYENET